MDEQKVFYFSTHERKKQLYRECALAAVMIAIGIWMIWAAFEPALSWWALLAVLLMLNELRRIILDYAKAADAVRNKVPVFVLQPEILTIQYGFLPAEKVVLSWGDIEAIYTPEMIAGKNKPATKVIVLPCAAWRKTAPEKAKRRFVIRAEDIAGAKAAIAALHDYWQRSCPQQVADFFDALQEAQQLRRKSWLWRIFS